MRISQRGINLIKRWEGCRLRAYRDVKGVWTIGWGTTDPKYAFDGNEITQAQADHLFMQDVLKFQREIAPLIKAEVAQAHWDALVSLAYNIGAKGTPQKPGLRESTLLRKLNQGDYAGAQAQFSRWIYSGGKIYQGLINRRAAEARVFQEGTEELMSRRVQLKETVSAEESEQIEPTPASTNVEANTAPSNTPGEKATYAGGAGLAVVSQAAEQISPLAHLSPYIGMLAVGLILLGLYFTVKKEGS
jgi:lysozyme